jgi:hypothetical protein
VTITFEQVLDLEPCPDYPNARLHRLFPATLRDVLTRRDSEWWDVPLADRLWLAVRVLPEPLVRRWLAVVVERALGRVTNPDPRSLAVLPHLRDGRAVPDAVRRAAATARSALRATEGTVALDAAAASAADWAAEDDADAWTTAASRAVDAATASAIIVGGIGSDIAAYTERLQQIADLLTLIEEVRP